MRKKILSFLLILAIFFTILPVQTVSAATDDEELVHDRKLQDQPEGSVLWIPAEQNRLW